MPLPPTPPLLSTELEPENVLSRGSVGGPIGPNGLMSPAGLWDPANKLEEPCSNCWLMLPGALMSCAIGGTLGSSGLSDLQSDRASKYLWQLHQKTDVYYTVSVLMQ
jgi:hypothetical protein